MIQWRGDIFVLDLLISFMLQCKSLLEYTNLFSFHEYNIKIFSIEFK